MRSHPAFPRFLAALLSSLAPLSAQTVYTAFNVGNDHPNASGQTNVASPYSFSAGGSVTVDGGTYVSDSAAAGASFSVTNGAWNTNSLHVGYSAGTGGGAVTLDGSGSTLAVASTFNVGFQKAGSLSLLNGADATGGTLYVGYTAAANGTFTVSGSGSSLALTSSLTAGYFGTGAVTVASGAQATMAGATLGSIAGATGTFTVSGGTVNFGSSSSVFVGSSGTGTLSLDTAGIVTAGFTYLGYSSGSSGTLTASGSGSSFTNSGYFYVGHDGAGTLRVENGASVVENGYGYLYLGYNAGSTGTATVTGAGSSLSSSQYLYVGYGGTGTLNIEDGGSVSTVYLRTSYNGGTGTINITGAGSTLNPTTSLGWAFGDYGATTVNVTNGGKIDSPNGTGVNHNGTLNVNSGGTLVGRLTISGGTINIGSGTTLTNGLDFYRDGAYESTLNVLNGGSLGGAFNFFTYSGATGFNRINVRAGGSITSSLSLQQTILSGSGTLTSALTVGSGSRVLPGDTVGTLRVNGNTTLSGGSHLVFEIQDAIGGAGTGWDLLSTGGTLRINGRSTNRITLSLLGLDANGDPGSILNFNPAQNYSWSLLTGASSLTYGTGGSIANSFTLDLSGFANLYDGTFSLSQSGTSLALNYTASAIPEPSTYAALAGAAGLLFAGWRRRRVRISR